MKTRKRIREALRRDLLTGLRALDLDGWKRTLTVVQEAEHLESSRGLLFRAAGVMVAVTAYLALVSAAVPAMMAGAFTVAFAGSGCLSWIMAKTIHRQADDILAKEIKAAPSLPEHPHLKSGLAQALQSDWYFNKAYQAAPAPVVAVEIEAPQRRGVQHPGYTRSVPNHKIVRAFRREGR